MHPAAAAAIDAAAIIVFAAVGRASHDESVLAGLARTSWPFLAGAAIGWIAARAWRNPTALAPTGVIIWGCTLVGGMLLRVVSDQGTALSFIIVAGVILAVLLLGWRAAATALTRGRT